MRAKAGAAPATIGVGTAEYAQICTISRSTLVGISVRGGADDDFGLTWLPMGTGRLAPAD
ncbi:hypothetical protein [Embleya sp. NPDC005575]|uniref:hypothetical protein n=1 Tax=Embleya sp. NPDC005575 TaxID=3156892 RepID=UPI0033BCDD99